MNLYKHIDEINREEYVVATYAVSSLTTLNEAAWNIAIGQSVGNPNVRNEWETDQLFENHSCLILDDEAALKRKKQGRVRIAFPVANSNWATDGISHLMCQLMGGHLDISLIARCSLIDLQIPAGVEQYFLKPKYGISGIRTFTGQHNKPLSGAIIKPKTGISVKVLTEMTKQLLDGGVDFIKEDEIMSNPACCPLEQRVEAIANLLARQKRNVVFCHTINSDPHALLDRARTVAELGGNGIHINIWGGLGSYNSVRRLDLPLYMHFQKSGDRIFTDSSHRFNVSWSVICRLATLMGVDTIQAGMIGGYSHDDPDDLNRSLEILRAGNTLPALSCGMHPGLVNKITSIVGIDYLANVGGAIHGHPSGTTAGARAMRQAIDGVGGSEYLDSIAKWGLQ
jgi:ribulose-bisphosphate carboxylase large chain